MRVNPGNFFGLIFVLALLSGCGVYRTAAVQGASDVGTVVGTAIGVPLGAAVVMLHESVKTAHAAVKAPRLYENDVANSEKLGVRYEPIRIIPPNPIPEEDHSIVRYREPQYVPVTYQAPLNRFVAVASHSAARTSVVDGAEEHFWTNKSAVRNQAARK